MIDLYLIGDAEVVQRLDKFTPRLKEEMRAGIGRLALRLARNVKSQKLSGQVLKVRTGRLRRSIADTVTDEGNKVVGMVSTAVKYGRVHEYGFQGTVTVREHLRTIKMAFGRPIAPVTFTMPEHSMRMNLPERSFLRSALRDLEASGAITKEMEAAVRRADA